MYYLKQAFLTMSKAYPAPGSGIKTGHFSRHQTYEPTSLSSILIICHTKSRLFSQNSTMNQTIAATEDLTPLQIAPDTIDRDTPSVIYLDTLSLGYKAEQRSVRFASNVSKIVGRVLSRDDFSEDERADYWIGRKESFHCQSKAKRVVMAVEKHGSEHVHFLEESYEVAQFLSEVMVDDNDIELFFGDPSCYTEKMEMWSAAYYGQRGLERYISSLQKRQRTLEKYETRRMVLVAAKSVSADELAEFYAAISWTTCIYSRMLGHADYAAAHFVEDATPVELKPVHTPSLKNEYHSEPYIRNFKASPVVQNLEIKLNVSSQDRKIRKQGHGSTQDILVSRAA
jgi:hypothetical protein